MSSELIRISPVDNVAVALVFLAAGTEVSLEGVALRVQTDIPQGHKISLVDLRPGQPILKYGQVMGEATVEICRGSHVHTHNVRTTLSDNLSYDYKGEVPYHPEPQPMTIRAYRRKGGEIGIRNEIWVIPTVGCVNRTAQRIVARAREELEGSLADGIHTFPHPYGCSQLGDDHALTRQTLVNLALHPNAGGVLVLGLGCENNGIAGFREAMGDRYDPERIRFLVAQDCVDEEEAAMASIRELLRVMEKDRREEVPFSKLRVGFKCGGSDGFSGITANPLVGHFSDWHVGKGGTAVLTEVPEMFGAETLLMDRCVQEAVFDKLVAMINGFKAYFRKVGQPIYENPSPGNKSGGITTLEDKSLGCIQKGGRAPVVDVLDYGERLSKPGLNLMNGPGNDMVSVTALTASGAHMVLFTTGRGTPFGGPVPTLKLATNSALARHKPNWIDFDAGCILAGRSFEEARDDLIERIRAVANGECLTRNEQNGYREISIFKDGVTL